MSRRLICLIGMVALVLSLTVRPQSAAANELCFPADKSPHCLADPFADYWEDNGGLPVFGYPVTAAAPEANADTGQTYSTQWVERTRLEDHPENAGTPYRVLLGLLGKERLGQLGRDAAAEGREAGPQAGCLWFEQTGHNVCNIEGGLGFRQYWESHGLKIAGLSDFDRSLQLFGLPLTAPRTETNASGDTVITQWFERARFEWHPKNPADYKVLLGLLGREVLDARTMPLPGPVPPVPADPCQGVPAPSKESQITPNCLHGGDAFSAVGAGFIKGEQVGIYVTGPDGATFVPAIIAGDAMALADNHYHLKAALPAFSQPGDYTLVLEGVRSELRLTFPFRILSGPPAGKDESLLPASSNGIVDPVSGPRGTSFTFSATGFNSQEPVAVYGTNPDGSGIDGVQMKADRGGQVGQNLTFTTDQSDQIGVYATTFEGLDSGHKAILYLRVTP
jgi:hypothetical protein